MSDLIVYDCEATDVDVRHGQITQFASLRANERLEVLEERNIRIRRLSYVVPAPEALKVTKTDPFDLDADDLPTEYEAASDIERALMPRFGRDQVNVTFNGPGFDDEALRTMLFRNMRYPWFSSGKNIVRVDMLSVIRLLDAAAPGTIVIPETGDGRQTWRLEKVCPANGIEIDAHDALGDVRATFELAKLVMERAPWAWDIARRAGSANGAESLLAAAERSGLPVHQFTHFGKPDVVPCAVLGTDRKKKWILADLRRDDVPTDADSISEGLYTKESPFRVVRSGGCPIFLTDDEVARFFPDIDRGNLIKAATIIKQGGILAPAAVDALGRSTFEMPEAATSEERIYDGFVQNHDKDRMGRFNTAKTWAERAAVRFSDDRLKDFAGRIVTEAISSGRAQSVPPDLAASAAAACAGAMERPFAPADARWMTIEAALESGADERWKEWSERTFSPAPAAVADEPQPPRQLGFGF